MLGSEMDLLYKRSIRVDRPQSIANGFSSLLRPYKFKVIGFSELATATGQRGAMA